MRRALAHRNALEEAVADYLGREPYDVRPNADGEHVLHVTEQPPVQIAVILGELLDQYRSALDHLFFELVERNIARGRLPADWARRAYFPLLTKFPKNAPPVTRSHFSDVIDGVTDEAFTFIESLQPYHRSQGASALLMVLAKLSNIDKHRRLNTTVIHAERHDTIVTGRFTSTTISIGIEDGAVLHPAPSGRGKIAADDVYVQTEFVAKIAVDEPELGRASFLTFDRVVYQLPTLLYATIIPRFQPLLDQS